jgi:hypothetical protein
MYVLLNIFEGKKFKKSTGLLRNRPSCGDLPITKIHPYGFRDGEWLLSIA